MITKVYEIQFRVTETLKNGKERTKKKLVYACLKDEEAFDLVYFKIKDAIEQLKSEHYYDIVCEDMKLSNVKIV